MVGWPIQIVSQPCSWVYHSHPHYVRSGSVTPGTVPIEALYLVAAEAGFADDHYSWFSCTWDGWKWWWNNRALSRLIMDGPDIPASHRLRGRKKWEGAEEIIWRANGKVKPGKPAL
jgi:dimethylaniline monooxygenase (N-oxide forming)